MKKENLNFSSNALVVLKKRYLKKNEKGEVIEFPYELVERVAEAISSVERRYGKEKSEIEKIKGEFFNIIANLEFMPNSPTLMNAGKELGQLSACFVIPVEDSMESIFDAIKATALVHKTGGGTGFSFSRLRPKNSVVKSTGGIASGPISFMRVFDAATQAVKQGGTRRGANMGILRVDHPDILEFVACKEKEGSFPNFNISVAITDDFMEKVLRNEDYELIDPHTGEVKGKLNARKVFDLIATYAHKNGEPGIVFIDRINKYNPTPHLGEIESTNPCVVGETLVATEKGLMRMKDIVKEYPNGGLKILVDEGALSNNFFSQDAVTTLTKRKCSLQTISRAFSTGTKPCYRLVTESGYEIIGTSDHKVLTEEGFKEISKLREGLDKVYIQSEEGYFNSNYSLPFEVSNKFKGENGKNYTLNLPNCWSKELGEVLGWLLGDGWIIEEGKNCRVGFVFGEDDLEVLEYFKKILNGYYGKEIKEIKRENGVWHLSYHSKYFVEFFKKLGIKSWKAEEKRVPESIFTAPYEVVTGFLRGLFSADGTIVCDEKKGNRYVRLTSKSLVLLKEIQVILLNLGIKSKIYSRMRKEREGFEYLNKRGERKIYLLDGILYELHIFKRSLKKFLEKIDFLNKKHLVAEKIMEEMYSFCEEEFLEKIVKVECIGEREVFDLTEPITYTFITNGFISLDCGEQPLLPYEACNLGSINLARMLKRKTDKFEIDWDKLEKVTHLAVRFLDNVIDVNKFPIPQIKENTLKTRKIGLGIMGWATMLGFLEIPYDSEEAIELAKKVMSFIYQHAQEESVRLAKEKGVFPAWKGSVWEKRGIRIRNATLTTIAPTGTISIIAGPTSSGIEPNFSLCYFRNVLEGEKLLEVDPAFEYIAKRDGFYSENLMRRIASGESIQKMKEIPENIKRVFKTALEISCFWHIKMQAVFQEFTDNAVSKTINLPNSATVEDVKEAYLLAYKLGCKGITVYRDGSRTVQVLTVDKVDKKEEKKKIKTTSVAYPKPRSEVIVGTTTKISTGCGNLYITLNQDEEGNFFEVFTQMGKAGGCAASQLEAIGRLISLALRGGMDIKVIVEQLKGIRCPSPSWTNGQKIFSCADAIARVLEKRCMDQRELVKVDVFSEKENEEKAEIKIVLNNIVGVCPECGTACRHQEGCMICDTCGYSKC